MTITFPGLPEVEIEPLEVAVPEFIELEPLAAPPGIASVTPIAVSRPPVGDTGPAVAAIMAAGAAVGFAWTRRKRRKK